MCAVTTLISLNVMVTVIKLKSDISVLVLSCTKDFGIVSTIVFFQLFNFSLIYVTPEKILLELEGILLHPLPIPSF